MTDKIKYSLLCMLVAIVCGLASAASMAPEYGLYIQAYPTPGNMHTTLSLDGGKPIEFDGDELRLSAEVWLRPENVLGTVFRIITDNGANVDLMYSVEDNLRYPMLVTGEQVGLQTVLPAVNEWVHVSVSVNPENGKVALDYDGTLTEMDYSELIGAKSARIDWGLCLIEGKSLQDVASVNVKDITLRRDGKEIRHWKLRGHKEDVCYDDLEGAPALAVNPKWMIDETASWKKIYSTSSLVLPSVAFDPVMATFYIVGKGNNDLFVYHPSENVIDTIPAFRGNHAAVVPNELIYIDSMHKLLSFNISEHLFSSFDSGDFAWSSIQKADPDHDFWYSSVCYNEADSALVSFGGYGHYRYNNILLTSFPFDNKAQTKVMLDMIDPRRSSSTAIVDGNMYIYGGWGCYSGRQELSAHPYYDMYRVNLADDKVEKLWKLDKSPFESDFIGVENMIYSPDNKCFYVFSTLDGGVLLKVSPTTGEMERMSLPVGFDTENHTFYGNLFYSPGQKKLYVALVAGDVENHADLSIFELPYPPIPVADLGQSDVIAAAKVAAMPKKYGIWGSVIILIVGVLVAWIIRRGKHRDDSGDDLTDENYEGAHDMPEEGGEDDVVPDSSEVIHHEDTEIDGADDVVDDNPLSGGQSDRNDEKHSFVARLIDGVKTSSSQDFYQLDRSCIRFFGGFRVFDGEGSDITSQFSPTLKNLMLILVFYSYNNSVGISNSRLQSFLWPGKDEVAAKNSRNVCLSRLRSLIAPVGDISMPISNGLRRMVLGDGVLCDYVEALRLLKEDGDDRMPRLLELLSNGAMLPNVELDYIDPFKSGFSDQVIELLSKSIRDEKYSIDLRLKMANVLFLNDPINEDALFMKCQILHFQGRTGMAQSVYNYYCREYLTLMGDPYPRSFIDIIK